MLLHEARRTARVDAAGDLVLLGDQDRELWDSELICEAQSLIERALKTRRIGPYVLQAAIVAVHSEAPKSWNYPPMTRFTGSAMRASWSQR